MIFEYTLSRLRHQRGKRLRILACGLEIAPSPRSSIENGRELSPSVPTLFSKNLSYCLNRMTVKSDCAGSARALLANKQKELTPEQTPTIKAILNLNRARNGNIQEDS